MSSGCGSTDHSSCSSADSAALAKKNASDRICYKCKKEPATLLQSKGICRQCFVEKALTKHKNTFRSKGCVDTDDKVLVAVSGGLHSRALLHLVSRSGPRDRRGRGRFDFEIIFVDDRCILPDAPSAATSVVEYITALGEKYGVPAHVVPLTSLFEGSEDRVRDLFATLHSVTEKEDMLDSLRNQILAQFAQQHSFTHVIRGDSATRLAQKVISFTSKGRGDCLQMEVNAFRDLFGARFVFPLRGMLSKEAGYYCHAKKLSFHFRPCFCSGHTGAKGGINVLTESK